MNDRKLADAVVRIIGGVRHPTADWTYRLTLDMPPLTATDFVRDWRVAGAVMQKVTYVEYKHLANGNNRVHANIPNVKGVKEAFNESLPRAIIQACVAALSTVADKQEGE